MKPVENEELVKAKIIRVFFYGVNESCKCLELMPTEEEMETLTFNDIIKLAEQNGQLYSTEEVYVGRDR